MLTNAFLVRAYRTINIHLVTMRAMTEKRVSTRRLSGRPIPSDRITNAMNPDPHIDRETKRIARALLALTIVISFGTIGFMIVQEEWGFWRSLYFTVITITTVGYGDYGLSEAGERFTAILLIFGIGTATYTFSEVVKAAIIYQSTGGIRMQNKVSRLRGHYIVCGFGRVGNSVCQCLLETKSKFVVVDNDESRFETCVEKGYLAICGNASEDAVLHRAGIEHARGVVCAVASDSENIVITLSARELNPNTLIVSRADAEDAIHKIRRAGASHVVSPSLRGGEAIANSLTRPHLSEFIDQSRADESDFKLGEVLVDEDSALVGQTLREYGSKARSVAFLAIKHPSGKTRVRPSADERFQPGDIVFVVGDPDGVYQMSNEAAPTKAHAKPKKALVESV